MTRGMFTKMDFDLLANLGLLKSVWSPFGEGPTRMQRVPWGLHLAPPSFGAAGFSARSMNTEAIHDTVPKRSIVADEEALGKRNPYVIDDQVATSKVSAVEVGDGLQ